MQTSMFERVFIYYLSKPDPYCNITAATTTTTTTTTITSDSQQVEVTDLFCKFSLAEK